MSDTTKARIVVGVDGSPASKKALRWAARLAATEGAYLEAVIAWDLPHTYGWTAYPGDWDVEAMARTTLQETLDDVFGADRPTGLQTLAREGGAARVLLARSEGALMAVVGSRGHGGFTGLLLGSVSTAVAEHAHCPVLVVHADSAD